MSNESFLNQNCFFLKDSNTGESGYNLASLLLFGKKESILNKIPSYRVEVIKKYKDLDRYDDRYICEKNLIESYELLNNYIDERVESGFYLDNNRTTNVVGIIIRELVSNILIHRNFSDNGKSRILLYKNYIVSENPNISKTLTNKIIRNVEPFTKNAIIARKFREIGYADELGSGFRNISSILKKHFNSKPEIYDQDIFKIKINFADEKEIEKNDLTSKEKILTFIKENGKITNSDTRMILDCERTRASMLLSELVDKNIIYRHGDGPATFYNLDKNTDN